MYKERFENINRIARKITSTLNIGDILEMKRDEVKVAVPHAQEACLLMLDPEALRYTRPLHCTLYKNRINCQLCKRGRETIKAALDKKHIFNSARQSHLNGLSLLNGSEDEIHEVAIPIFDGIQPLAVLDVIAREGTIFSELDLTLLKDLADLASNVISNAKRHWTIAQEKLNLDKILTHLRPFVPETVQKIVDKDPASPFLGKTDTDVTVLFLDIAGYTRISEYLTQEKLNFIIEKYFSSFLEIIYKYGGDINETAGDGLMIIFEGEEQDNALRASKAAREIRQRCNEINRELEGRFDSIYINMGLNSGIASVGITKLDSAAGTRMTYTATGPGTNLAARIAAMAEDGDILVGPETARRIKKKLPLFNRGIMKFKNVAGEVQVHSLIRKR